MDQNLVGHLCHPQVDDAEFYMRELRSLEFRAYAAILSAFRAGGELDEDKRGILGLIRQTLNISELRHKSEVRRVATNPRLALIANKIQGFNTNQEWIDEGFCESPFAVGMSRFPTSKTLLSHRPPSDSPTKSLQKAPKKITKKLATVHDFGRAIKSEKSADPSIPIPNGWAVDMSDLNIKHEPISSSTSSSSSCESESSVDLSYSSLKKKGRIRLQKRANLLTKFKKPLTIHPVLSPVIPQQASPDVTQVGSPIKRDALPPAPRRGRGAKRKILCPSGKIKLSPIPRKQVKVDEHGQTIVENSAIFRGRGRGRGGIRRGGLTNGRGKIRLGLKPNQRVLKIKTPTKNIRLKSQQSKRKQLDQVRQELKSDDEDKKSTTMKRSSSTESVNRSSSSDDSELDKKVPGPPPPPPLRAKTPPKPIILSSSESDVERWRERESSPAISEKMNNNNNRTPPKPPQPARSPLPAPVFSTSLDATKKRPKILNNFPSMSSELSGVATASSLATRRPPVFSSTPPTAVAKPPGILPQRKAQPHILVNSKAQRAANASAAANSNNNVVVSTSTPSPAPSLTSSVITQQQPQQQVQPQQLTQQVPPAPAPGAFVPNFPVVSSLGMGTPVTYGSMKTSQGANIIFLQKAPGGGLTPAGPVGSSVTVSSAATGITTCAPLSAASVQLPQKNSPRAVILRRANLPRQGNVMILDMQKNQVMSANPQFLQTARILNSPELTLVANLQNSQGNSVRKIVSSSGGVVGSTTMTVSSTTHQGLTGATGVSGAPPGCIPLRFPIHSSQFQQLQQQQQQQQQQLQQQQSPLKAKRVGRVFGPRDMKTVIRVSGSSSSAALPVQMAPSAITAAGTILSGPKDEPGEVEPIQTEAVYEEEVMTSAEPDRSSTNVEESSRRSNIIRGDECNNELNGELLLNHEEEIVTEAVEEFVVASTEEVISAPAMVPPSLTEDVFQTALKSAGLDFSGAEDFGGVGEEAHCTNEPAFVVQEEITTTTSSVVESSDFPFPVNDLPATEEVVTTQQC